MVRITGALATDDLMAMQGRWHGIVGVTHGSGPQLFGQHGSFHQCAAPGPEHEQLAPG